MHDRRRCIRWEIDRQAKLALPEQKGEIDCQIKDINFNGAQISLAGHLEKDAYIALSIHLSSDCTLNLEAWVAWHKTIDGHHLYGLYFNRIKDPDKEKIYQFMRDYFPQKINQQWWKDLSAREGGEIMQKADVVRDRRIFARFPARFPVKFLVPDLDKEGQAQTQDISAKGLALEMAEGLPPHTSLEMWLEIPDKGEPLYSRGEVVWSKRLEPDKYRAGIELERADLMGMSRVLRTR